MLGSLRAHRTLLAPLVAGLFVLGLLVGAGAGTAHATEPAQAETRHLHHADQGDQGGHRDPAAPRPAGQGGHGCDICICFAAAGGCSVPALAAEISLPADAAITLGGGLAAPASPPGSSPPHDIFHPPQS